jgi:hypothetical protein
MSKETDDSIELSEYKGTDIEVRTDLFEKPLYGKLISEGPTFCTFKRMNCKLVTINKRNILEIRPIKWRGERHHDY